MPITDIAIRSATPSAKPVRLFDGGGLSVPHCLQARSSLDRVQAQHQRHWM